MNLILLRQADRWLDPGCVEVSDHRAGNFRLQGAATVFIRRRAFERCCPYVSERLPEGDSLPDRGQSAYAFWRMMRSLGDVTASLELEPQGCARWQPEEDFVTNLFRCAPCCPRPGTDKQYPLFSEEEPP